MLCGYGCGKEAKYQLNNGKWCCEEIYQRCPEMKKKFLKSKKEKVKCPRCGRLISKNTINRHLKKCLTSKCAQCDTPIDRDKKFCSHRCAAIYNNQRASYESRRHTHKKDKCKNTYVSTKKYCTWRPLKPCANCGKYINSRKKYCSTECATLYRKKLKWEEIKAGNCTYPRTIKQYMIEHYGNKCWICGTEEWQGQPVPLIIDHVDGNSYNNEFVNFRLVCGNCDMQLPTYKGRNVGNGRHNRRKRYSEGKSY